MTKRLAYSFPAIAMPDARILILGSMPGVASLKANQYYGHPRNAFWPIMAALFEFNATDEYIQRVNALQREQVAVWDVLKFCERTGSLDSAIVRESEAPNNIAELLANHPQIKRIFFNGQKAEACFVRHCKDLVKNERLTLIRLPSTSPAHAGLSVADKLEQWRAAIAGAGGALC